VCAGAPVAASARVGAAATAAVASAEVRLGAEAGVLATLVGEEGTGALHAVITPGRPTDDVVSSRSRDLLSPVAFAPSSPALHRPFMLPLNNSGSMACDVDIQNVCH
jgi:hypothetical protein